MPAPADSNAAAAPPLHGGLSADPSRESDGTPPNGTFLAA